MARLIFNLVHFFLIWGACKSDDFGVPTEEELLSECPQVRTAVYTPTCLEASPNCIQTTVSLRFVPERFMGIDDPSETMTMSGLLQANWTVPCPSLMRHVVRYVTLTYGYAIWTPVMYHMNAVGDYAMKQNFAVPRVLLLLSNQFPKFVVQNIGVFSSSCETFDYSYFPFDSQFCSVRFSMPYVERSVKLGIDFRQEEDIANLMDSFMPAGEGWKFMNATFTTFMKNDNSHALFTFFYKRKPFYYISSSMLPVLLLAILQLAGFFVNPDGSERAMFNVTLLLALTFLTTQIQAMVPIKPDPIFLLINTQQLSIFSWACTLYSIFIGWFVKRKDWCSRKVCSKYSLLQVVDAVAFCVALAAAFAISCYALFVIVSHI